MAVSSGAKKALTAGGALAGVAALLVGIGHWRAHDLVAGDVVWHAENPEGADEAVVVRGRVYTYYDDLLTIREVDTGATVAQELRDGSRAYVGDSGHVVVVELEHMTMYDRDGKQMWHRAMDDLYQPLAISVDGQLDAVACAGEGACSTVHLDAAGRDTSRAARRSPDFAMPAVIGTGTLDDDQHVLRVPTMPTDIDQKTHAVRQVRDGTPFGPPVRLMDDHVVAQVGDLLVGMSREDETCTFTAVRADKKAWTTSTRCPDLGFPDVDVFNNRMYVNNRSRDGYDVVTTDLDGRRAHSFRIRTGPTSESDRLQLSPTPNSVVLTLTDQISAYSPTTGKRLWVKKLNRTSHDALEKTKKIYPGIDVSGPVIDQYDNAPRPLAELAVGRDVPSYVHTFIDAESGDESAELAAPYGSVTQGLDDGRVLVLGPDDMWLVSP